MFFIILISLFNQFLPGMPVEREMMCCKMRENKLDEDIALCCIDNQKKDCEDNGCGGKCGDPLCHCPISDIQMQSDGKLIIAGRFSHINNEPRFKRNNGIY